MGEGEESEGELGERPEAADGVRPRAPPDGLPLARLSVGPFGLPSSDGDAGGTGNALSNAMKSYSPEREFLRRRAGRGFASGFAGGSGTNRTACWSLLFPLPLKTPVDTNASRRCSILRSKSKMDTRSSSRLRRVAEAYELITLGAGDTVFDPSKRLNGSTPGSGSVWHCASAPSRCARNSAAPRNGRTDLP